MARRTNYGFEKRQRELRKKKKKEEKAARRNSEEATSPAPGNDAAANDTRIESEPDDRD